MGYTPFKMKGFSGFGNSPAKDTKNDPDYDKEHQAEYDHVEFGPGDVRHKAKEKSSPAKQANPEAKKVISSGKIEGKEATMYTKGARPGKEGTREKGKKTTYVKGEGGTYTKKVQKIKKGATSDKEWETKKEKTISAKRAERQIKRKTRRAERSDKRADVRKIKETVKKARKGEDRETRKYYKEKGKAKIKEIRNR